MATNYDKWANFEKELEPDPEDIAREKLRRQKENMSDKEVRRLHDCWEEPEFRRMFEEYQEEVTDPKHRAETEEYLMQCEAEQRAGIAQRAVRLEPETRARHGATAPRRESDTAGKEEAPAPEHERTVQTLLVRAVGQVAGLGEDGEDAAHCVEVLEEGENTNN